MSHCLRVEVIVVGIWFYISMNTSRYAHRGDFSGEGGGNLPNSNSFKPSPGPLRSYIAVKENHICSAFSEILRYRHTKILLLYYKDHVAIVSCCCCGDCFMKTYHIFVFRMPGKELQLIYVLQFIDRN